MAAVEEALWMWATPLDATDPSVVIPFMTDVPTHSPPPTCGPRDGLSHCARTTCRVWLRSVALSAAFWDPLRKCDHLEICM